MAWQLAAHMGFFLLNAALYLVIGELVRRGRVASADAARARGLFATWWYAIAGTGLAQAADTGAVLLGLDGVGLHVALLLATLLLLSVALCGLVYYLFYLFMGERRLLVPIVLLYAAFLVYAVSYVLRADPVGVVATNWHVRLAYASPPPPAYRAVLFALLILPQIGGAIAYATLLRAARDPEIRYRIVLVSAGIVVWSLHTVIEGARVMEHDDVFQLGLRATGAAAILLVLAAYKPPGWVRRRLARAEPDG